MFLSGKEQNQDEFVCSILSVDPSPIADTSTANRAMVSWTPGMTTLCLITPPTTEWWPKNAGKVSRLVSVLAGTPQACLVVQHLLLIARNFGLWNVMTIKVWNGDNPLKLQRGNRKQLGAAWFSAKQRGCAGYELAETEASFGVGGHPLTRRISSGLLWLFLRNGSTHTNCQNNNATVIQNNSI